MKMNKAFADLMLQSFGANYNSSLVTYTGGVVLSLWSGSPMDQANMDTIRDTLTYADGTIQSNWPDFVMTNQGRTELARLAVPNFAERSDSGVKDKRFALSKIPTPMSILAAGTVGSFTLSLVSTNWATYAGNVANNRARTIFSGTVSDLEGSGELKLSTTSLTLNTLLFANDIVFKFNIPSLEVVW